MALDRTWLLAAARAEREALGRTIQYTEPRYWDQPVGDDGWRIRDVLAHLAASDVAAAAALGDEEQAEIDAYFKGLPEGGLPTVDGFNAFAVERRANAPAREVIREWGRAADLLLARSSEVPAEDWPSRRVYWVAGQMRVPNLVQSRVMEWWLHGEDVRRGAELPTRREHGPIYCVNDLAVRTIPYALSLAGLSFPGRIVRIQLRGQGQGSWVHALAPKDSLPADATPDVAIEGEGYWFAKVAGRRVPAEACLEDGRLIVGGDVALGGTILANLRAFA
jgi:uncharacterized protein (TIGR03083 family)